MNGTWVLDVVANRPPKGKPLRTLVVVEQHTKVILAIEPGQFVVGQQIANCLNRVAAKHGYPKMISTDNGVTFSSEALESWAGEHRVVQHFHDPHKPAMGSSAKVLQALKAALSEGTVVAATPGLPPDYAQSLADWTARYNESRRKAWADDEPTQA